MIDPTPYLSPCGLKRFNKLKEWQKKRPLDYLRGFDFATPSLYELFSKECRISPFRNQLLEEVQTPTDPKFVENLCKMLADLQDKIDELESEKQDKPYDY